MGNVLSSQLRPNDRIRRGNDRHIGIVGIAEFAVVEAVATAASVPDEVEAVCRPESLRRDDILAPVRRFAALGIAGVVTRPAENGKAQGAHFVAVNLNCRLFVCYNGVVMSEAKQSRHDREIADIRQLIRENEERAAKRAAEADRRAEERAAEAAAEAKKRAAEAEKRAAEAAAEAKKRAEEAEKRAAEAEKRAAEAEKRAEERAAEEKERAKKVAEEVAEIRGILAETDKQIAQTEKQLAKTDKIVGNFTRGEGEIMEVACVAALRARGEIGGIKLDRVYPRIKGVVRGMEVDGIGVNGKVVIPVEVKRTLRPEHVHNIVGGRIDRFPEEFPDFAQGKDKVIGAIIFALRVKEENDKGELEDPVELALKAGLLVMQSVSANKLKPVNSLEDVAPPDKD